VVYLNVIYQVDARQLPRSIDMTTPTEFEGNNIDDTGGAQTLDLPLYIV